MPIRLNLLAEAQAAEELRRRDPAKRALWAAAFLISAMLVWSSSLFLKGVLSNNALSAVQYQMNSRTNLYQSTLDNQKKAAEINAKLAALNRLATNRFLNGTLLNALQQTTREDVSLVHLKVEQIYSLTEESKTRTNANKVLPPKAATVTEKIVVSLDGKDSSPSGDRYDKFRDALAGNPYFQAMLSKTNGVTLKSFVPAAAASPDAGKTAVQFMLECRYTEKTR